MGAPAAGHRSLSRVRAPVHAQSGRDVWYVGLGPLAGIVLQQIAAAFDVRDPG